MHATVGLLIKNVVVVKKLLGAQAQRLVKLLAATVHVVRVGGNAPVVRPCHDELEEQREEIHLLAIWLHWIIQGGVSLIV